MFIKDCMRMVQSTMCLDGDVANGPADENLGARLVCDWSMSDALVDQFLSHF